MTIQGKEKKILWSAVVLYILVIGTMAVLRHYQFQTQTWDMGAFVQTFWNTIQGRVMFNNLEEVSNHLGVHMSPFLFLLVPGYALFQSPYFLLIIQTLGFALGAWPLYLLARKILQSERWAFVVSIAYLVYPATAWVNLFDFHEIAFFVPLALAAFYFWEEEKYHWAWVFLALCAAVEENAIIAVGFMGLYFVLKKSVSRSARKQGFLLIILSLIYFFVAIKILMPALGGGLLRLDRYVNLGDSPVNIVQNVAANPMLLWETVATAPKFFYALWMFLPVMFLPFFSGRALVLLIPGLLQNLLTGNEFQFSGVFQYDGILIAAVFVCSIWGLQYLLDHWPGREKIWQWTLLAAVLIGFMLRSPVKPINFPVELFGENPRWEAFREMIALVPDDAAVAAQTNIVPHLSHREHAHMLGREPMAVDMVLVDAQDSFGFPDTESFQRYIDSYLDSGLYSVIYARDERFAVIVRNGLLEQ